TGIIIPATNAIENINSQLRKIIKNRGHFPTDEAANKLIWLGLHNITADWWRASHDMKTAINPFAILYEDRFVRPSV
ncbi:IS256 family transposase, partial [Pseudomonas sp. MWU12-2534b]